MKIHYRKYLVNSLTIKSRENDSLREDKNNKGLLTSDSEASIPQDNLDTPRRRTLEINEKENKLDKICDLHKYVQSLATEREGIKLFNKEKFYLLAQLVSEINSNTDTTDNTVTETTDLLYKQNEFFYKKTSLKTLS